MKKTENEPVCIYRNTENEEKVKTDLSQAMTALQSVLAVWNGLDLVPCKDIRALILNPQKCYEDAVNETVEVPVQPGKYQISKDIWIKNLSIPVPNSLYLSCKNARQYSYAAVPDLWSIEGDQVIMNTSEATKFIDAQSIYADDEKKIEFCNDLETFVKLFSKLNTSLKGQLSQPTPNTYEFCRGKFEVKEAINNSFEIVISPPILRKWLNEIVQS